MTRFILIPTYREEIKDEFVIYALQIGAAEIGNWGQPFRKTPDFAVRNLDGVIDEMIILNAALSVSYTHLRAHETRGNLVCRVGR